MIMAVVFTHSTSRFVSYGGNMYFTTIIRNADIMISPKRSNTRKMISVIINVVILNISLVVGSHTLAPESRGTFRGSERGPEAPGGEDSV